MIGVGNDDLSPNCVQFLVWRRLIQATKALLESKTWETPVIVIPPSSFFELVPSGMLFV